MRHAGLSEADAPLLRPHAGGRAVGRAGPNVGAGGKIRRGSTGTVFIALAKMTIMSQCSHTACRALLSRPKIASVEKNSFFPLSEGGSHSLLDGNLRGRQHAVHRLRQPTPRLLQDTPGNNL